MAKAKKAPPKTTSLYLSPFLNMFWGENQESPVFKVGPEFWHLRHVSKNMIWGKRTQNVLPFGLPQFEHLLSCFGFVPGVFLFFVCVIGRFRVHSLTFFLFFGIFAFLSLLRLVLEGLGRGEARRVPPHTTPLNEWRGDWKVEDEVMWML